MADDTKTATVFMARVEKARIVRDTARTGYSYYKRWKAVRDAKNAPETGRYIITVEDDDRLFDMIQKVLLEDLDPMTRRSMVAESESAYNRESSDHSWSLRLVFNMDHKTHMDIDGHRVLVQVTSEKVAEPEEPSAPKSGINWIDDLMDYAGEPEPEKRVAGGGEREQAASSYATARRIVFTMDSPESRDAVIQYLDELTNSMNGEKRPPSFYMSTPTGYFRRMSNMASRPLDSVILAGDQKEQVIANLRHFLSTEAKYLDLGLPWHHGYLFHGPPGTGKTSLAAAIASTFDLDVYMIPLSSIESDARMMELMTNIDAERAVLVLEDIDIVHAAKERNDDNKGVTLQGLLNSLDGLSTPHGLITIMTTNDREVLDSALVRPGRVDYEIEITYVTDDQLERMCERFVGRRLELPAVKSNITPAEIVGFFKDDDDNLERRLSDFIERKNSANGVYI